MEALEPRLALAYSNYIAPDGSSWPVDQNTGMPYFHNYAAAPTTIYMDYDGDPGTYNGNASKLPPGGMAAFDKDGDPTHFLGTEERNQMWDNWRRLVSYFSPFNVDVTTQYVDPNTRPVAWLSVSETQELFAPLSEFDIGSFGSTDPSAHGFITPYRDPQTFAHEVGHAFGNVHQRNYDEFLDEKQDYGGPDYSVNGSVTDRLNGAIMGSKSGIINKFLKWNQVGSNYATVEDAQAVIANAIASRVGGTGYRPDDHVNAWGSTATVIATGIPKKGIIETTSDVDYFKFTVTTAGAAYGISLTRDLNSPLDTTLMVQDANGGLVVSYNGDTRAAQKQMVNDAHLMIPGLAVGTYYIRVTGNGNGGDVGPYFLRLDRFYDNQWRSTDIGQTTDGGYAYQPSSLNTYVVRGSGSDIWDKADGGHFLYKRLSGDGDILASPMTFNLSMTSIDEWAKVGVMMRTSLDPGALEVSLLDSWKNGTVVQHRTLFGGDTSTDYQNGGNFVPNQGSRYLRISRRGSTFTASISTDNGASFSDVWSSSLTGWGSTIYVGLVVTSHNDSSALSASFNNAVVIPVGNGVINPLGLSVSSSLPIPAAPTTQRDGGGGAFFTWPRVNDPNVTGYYIERSVNNVDWTMDSIISQPASGTPGQFASSLNDNCYYYFRIRSRNAQGYVSDVGPTVGYVLIQPKAVTNLRSIVSPLNQLILQWSDVAGESAYFVQTSDNYDAANPLAASWSLPIAVPANQMTWSESSIPTRRAYRVQSVQAGTVTATSPVLVAGRQISPATNVAITGISTGSMTVGWTAPSVTGGITYTVQYSNTREPVQWKTAAIGLTATSYTMSTQAGQPYYFRIISQSTATSGKSVSAVVFRGAWGTLPSGWSDTTVGSVGGYGSVNAPSGTSGNITIVGSGADVWGTSDNMHYMYRSFSSLDTMIVHVGSLERGFDEDKAEEWARAGLAFRSSTLSGSVSVGLFATTKHGLVFQTRTSSGGSTGFVAQQVNPPTSFQNVWIKLQRNSSNTFSAYYSYNSTTGYNGTWVLWATATVSMPSIYYGGLAVSSHDNNYDYKANFDHLITF